MPSLRSTAAAGLVAAASAGDRSCDLFAKGGTPCVAAHSLARALYNGYDGDLFQLQRASDGAVFDVGLSTPGGVVNTPVLEAFCAQTSCVISRIYDQSGNGNHLDVAPPGGHVKHGDKPVNATQLPITISGHPAYGALFQTGQGYRIDKSKGVATGNDPETLYMVTSAKFTNGGCCFDYGNAESNNNDDGPGTMEAIYFGTATTWGRGSGSGPWVMADLEDGLWAGSDRVNAGNTPVTSDIVFAMVKGNTNGFALKAADGNNGTLVTMYDGPRPNGYQPMRKQGSIILGIGGDNSDSATGVFIEGAITTGFSTDATDAAVAANVAASIYRLA